jgi:phosphatidylserine decarboxylase
VFAGGDVAIFRLTPEQYHYNHTPVSGLVREIYEVPGAYHACNPTAAVEIATPLSMNRRVVTIIDTDVDGGTGVGLVAMVEVVALMIGGIEQRYSTSGYDNPRDVVPGMFVERGVPKSLYRPGSSTYVLLFEPNRITFADDLMTNARRAIASRYRLAFHAPLVETELRVRSLIATPRTAEDHP